ncbi:MAG: hypothetical protein HQK49_22990 [Oligoflexia bacterium]|nr:hypothetical protein [Oligoflexia bacterium]
MKLSEAKSVFKWCQDSGSKHFIIRKHCWEDHPRRCFTKLEVLNLLVGEGTLKDNKFPSAQRNSFLWCCKDKNGNDVQITVVINNYDEITAIAISAYRKDQI